MNAKAEAIGYWEKRRIAWNVLLLPPALLSYQFTSGVEIGFDVSPIFGWPKVVALFCMCAVAANICYSFAYVIEFWIQGAVVEEQYRSFGRNVMFALGCLLGIGLSLNGGVSIARMQYPI